MPNKLFQGETMMIAQGEYRNDTHKKRKYSIYEE